MRKIQKFFSQPFFVAEQFTGNPGKFVGREDTVRSFKAILEGEYDDLPEDAFYMVGSIEDAIEKAKTFKFDLAGSVMASDAFFPFPDCIEIASEAGISAVVQPGCSIKDQLSIDACDERGMAMYLSGIRHFYH